MILALLLACDAPSRADYERLERRVEALEARAREEATAKADAARAAEAKATADAKDARARQMLARLQLINQPAPPVEVEGKPPLRLDTTLLVFFPMAPDSVAPLRHLVATVGARVPVLGVTSGPDSTWLTANDVQLPVVFDIQGRNAAAWHVGDEPVATLVKGGRVVWTGTPQGLDAGVLDKHLGTAGSTGTP